MNIFRIGGASNEAGLSIDEAIRMGAAEGISAAEMKNMVKFLADEGNLYSTIDDDHYRSTE